MILAHVTLRVHSDHVDCLGLHTVMLMTSSHHTTGVLYNGQYNGHACWHCSYNTNSIQFDTVGTRLHSPDMVLLTQQCSVIATESHNLPVTARWALLTTGTQLESSTASLQHCLQYLPICKTAFIPPSS